MVAQHFSSKGSRFSEFLVLRLMIYNITQWNIKTGKRHKSRDRHGARFSNSPIFYRYSQELPSCDEILADLFVTSSFLESQEADGSIQAFKFRLRRKSTWDGIGRVCYHSPQLWQQHFSNTKISCLFQRRKKTRKLSIKRVQLLFTLYIRSTENQINSISQGSRSALTT